MGQPLHQIPPEVRRQLAIRSANFTLYGDMSARICAILREAAPRIEVYSIDESFLDLGGIPERAALAGGLRDRVRQWTGIPNCVGIGATKTLAKLANHVAKSAQRKPGSYPTELAGVADLAALPAPELADVLAATPVQEVWGVGRRWGERLAALDIESALQLRDAPTSAILSRFGVVLARTQQELAGVSCIDLQEVEPDCQQIMVSRSFGSRVMDHAQVHQAMATFAQRACEKLRQRGLTTMAIGVLANTDWFKPELPQHHPQRCLSLTAPTADTRVVLAALAHVQQGLLRKGHAYKKAGVWLMDLARPGQVQADLFGPTTLGNEALMAAVDAINRRFGRTTVSFGAATARQTPLWAMRQQRLSGRFTTRWDEMPLAFA